MSKQYSKVLVVVQCRMQSSRLPYKALYPLAGIPSVVFLLRRLRQGLPQEHYRLILATGMCEANDALVPWVEEEGIEVVRGSESNVVSRYRDCLEKYPAEALVRVTADNPFTPPEFIRGVSEELERTGTDYCDVQNVPYGSGVEAYSPRGILSIAKKARSLEAREHLNYCVLNNLKDWNHSTWIPPVELQQQNIRITMDTLEDWQFLKNLVDSLGDNPWNVNLGDVLDTLAA